MSDVKQSVKRRFIAKPYGEGRALRWGVYDVLTASWPVERPGLGRVPQAFKSEAEAQTEADRCEEIAGGLK